MGKLAKTGTLQVAVASLSAHPFANRDLSRLKKPLYWWRIVDAFPHALEENGLNLVSALTGDI